MSHLPAGTVTFLFTDIEGSTRKWQNWPHKMKIALKRHDDILDEAVKNNGGWVFKTVGDAFCAAYHTAMDCINSVIDIQTAINSEDWDLPELIKVRMSIHTGEAIERNDDYYGPALNRVARLEAITYGGQVLMSLVTAELIRDMLPEPAGIKYMGDHRLKDLTRPEGVYQLTHPDLPADFPPIKSMDFHPHNLPIQPSLLVGREREVSEIQEKLVGDRSRVVTITGTGGMGKTRISLQTAAELIENFKNGVFFIDLTLISDADALYPLILSTLSINESGGINHFELLKGYFNDKDMLLILDNFEHIMDAAVHASRLLAECHGLKFLVTSREALHIRGEKVYRLPPLKVPVFDKRKVLSVEKITQYDSVNLFIERAQEVNEDFQVDNKNAPAVAEICVHLDGIPLAIELAAARITTLSPQALLKRLGHRLELLTFGAADLPDRHQTLRTTIDWSFNLLDKEMQDLFMSLSVFTGGFDIEAAEAVCHQTVTDSSVLDGIEHLLEKSLLIKKEMSEGESWFCMLETIHEYASEQLGKSNLARSIQEKYSEYFLELVENGGPGLHSPDQKYWMDKLIPNHENLIAVMRQFEVDDEIEKLARMADRLHIYWGIRGHFYTGKMWYEKILEKNFINKHLRIKLSIDSGYLMLESGEYQKASTVINGIINNKDILEGDQQFLYYVKGWVDYRLCQFDEAAFSFEKAMELSINSENRYLFAKANVGIGAVKRHLGEFQIAENHYHKALTILKVCGDISSVSQIINNLAIIYAETGFIEKSEKYFSKALKLLKITGDIKNKRDTLNNLGYLNIQKHNFNRAMKFYNELLSLVEGTEDNLYISTAYSGLASVNIELNNLDTALAYAEKALKFSRNYNTSREYGTSMRILGDIWRCKNAHQKAKEYYNKCIPILERTRESEDLEIALNSLKLLSNKENIN